MNNNITLNASMRSNLLSLRNISKQMDKTQLILATGKEVNSAIDNASSYYQARSLSNRAADLTALLDAMEQGIQTIEAATQGLTSGAEFLEQATAVVNEAASNVKYDFSDYTRVSTVEELKAAIADSNIDKIVVTQSLTFADNETITLTTGKTLAGLTQDVSLNFTRTDDAIKTYSMLTAQDGCKLQNITVNLAQNSTLTTYSTTAVKCTGKVELNDINIYAAGRVAYGLNAYGTISGNCNIKTSGSATIAFYMADAMVCLDANIVTTGTGIYAVGGSLDGNFKIKSSEGVGISYIRDGIIAGNYEINSYSYGINLGPNVTYESDTKIYSASENGVAMRSGVDTIFKAGIDFYLSDKNTILMTHWKVEKLTTGVPSYSSNYSQFMTKKEDSKNSADFASTLEKQLEEAFEVKENNYAEQYKKILEEYDNLLSDSSYQGINLLKGGNLEVTFNESRSNQYTVAGVLADSVSLGLETQELSDMSAIKKSLEEITKAVNSIRSFQEELGNHYSIIQTRINFTEALTDVLETGADDLTLADMNEASAQYLTLQTRQQLAINSLSLASQSASSIISLF